MFTRFLPKEDFSGLRALNFSIGMYLPKEYQVFNGFVVQGNGSQFRRPAQ